MTLDQAIIKTKQIINICEGALIVKCRADMKAELDYYRIVKEALEKMKNDK